MVDTKTLSLPTKSLQSRRRDKYKIIIEIINNNNNLHFFNILQLWKSKWFTNIN